MRPEQRVRRSRRRVLIVTSTYAPAMMADMQRARMLAWELPDCGWDVEVLAPDASYQLPVCLDGDSRALFCEDAPVHYAPQRHAAVFRLLRMRSIGWRSYAALDRLGRRLLGEKRYDCVYFSTTQFPLFALGRDWRRRYGVPYVLDFHDPCYREPSSPSAGVPPGLKRAVSRRISAQVEAAAVPAADGIVSVSPLYLDALTTRYERMAPSWVQAGRHAVIPFGGSARDLALVRQHATSPPRPAERRRIVYVGAGGPVMARSFAALCGGLAALRCRAPQLVNTVVLELYGTLLHWREGERRPLREIAEDHGVGDLVHEEPRHVSYWRSLELLLGADGALVLGVDDPGYMPSKLFTYALSGRPLLAVLDASSPGYRLFHDQPRLGYAVPSGSAALAPDAVAATLERFLREVAAGARHERHGVLAPYLAPAMAARHAALFEACLDHAA